MLQGTLLASFFIRACLGYGPAEQALLYGLGLLALIDIGILRLDAAVFFSLGFVLSIASAPFPRSLVLGFMICAAMVFVGVQYVDLNGVTLLRIIWCFAVLSVLLEAMRYSPSWVRSPVCWLGRNTLPILVLHALFVVVGGKIFLPMAMSVDQTGFLSSLCVTAFSLMGSILTAILMDRAGISSVLFGVKSIYKNYPSRFGFSR